MSSLRAACRPGKGKTVSQSRFERTRFKGSQDTYLTTIQDTALRLMRGDTPIMCPRDGCNSEVRELADGRAFVLFCPECGVIFRGNKSRLLAEARYTASAVESRLRLGRSSPDEAGGKASKPAADSVPVPAVSAT